MCILLQKDIDLISNMINKIQEQNKLQCYNPKYNVICCFFNDDITLFGYNNTKNINSQIPIQLHAELDALNKLPYKVNKRTTLNCLVLRYTPNKFRCNSRPCYYCAKKLCECCGCRIKNIYFFENEELQKQTIDELNESNTLMNLSSGFRYRMKIGKNKKLLKRLNG